jgi:methionyl-tRNA formyltransferase
LQIWRSRVADGKGGNQPGRLDIGQRRLLVDCAEGTVLELLEVQIEGRKRVSAEAFLHGQRIGENEILGAKPN